jgi:membrane protease YdiL (CAAX protease family)
MVLPNNSPDGKRSIADSSAERDAGAIELPLQSASEATTLRSGVSVPRFCSSCGAEWGLEWSECPTCAAQKLRVISTHSKDSCDGRSAVRSALCLYFSFLIIGLAVAIIVFAVRDDSAITECLSMITADSITSLVVLVWCVISWSSLRVTLLRVPSIKWFAVACLCAVATFTIATAAIDGLTKLVNLQCETYSAPFLASGFGWPTIILVICIQPAIIEELAFRGVIHASLERVLGANETILVTSLMFMIIHLSVPSFPHLLIIGLALGYIRHRCGSIYPGMLLHFLHNLFVVMSEKV